MLTSLEATEKSDAGNLRPNAGNLRPSAASDQGQNIKRRQDVQKKKERSNEEFSDHNCTKMTLCFMHLYENVK